VPSVLRSGLSCSLLRLAVTLLNSSVFEAGKLN
jgi:hypothetical protein